MSLWQELRTYGSTRKHPAVQRAELYIARGMIGSLLAQMGVGAFARLGQATSQLSDVELLAASTLVVLVCALGLTLVMSVLYRTAQHGLAQGGEIP